MMNLGAASRRILCLMGLLAGLLMVIALAAPADAQKKTPKYVGVKKCKKCHSKKKLGGEEFLAWEKTKHAKAMDILKPGEKAKVKLAAKLDPQKDYSNDATCLKCHTTGWGKPASAKAVLLNVQCEACHGPGSLYRKTSIKSAKKWRKDREGMRAKAKKAGLLKPTEEDCRKCHNDESPSAKTATFDFAKAKKEIKHWKDKK